MNTPKYVEIASIINTKIEEGEYAEGNKLPAHRVLAIELNTTPATVAKAYNLLSEQGRVASFVGRGSFVCQNKTLGQVIQPEANQNEINFSILQPCFDGEHLKILNQHIHSACASIHTANIHSYAESSGLWEHREAGMIWSQSFGLDASRPDDILLTNGAQHALSALVQLYTEPGDVIAVEAQTYPGILSIIDFLGRRVMGLPMDDKGMRPDALDEACTGNDTGSHNNPAPKMVILIPSHQNPTGITMPTARREAIAQVIDKHGLWLLEDDIYGFLNQTVIPPITNLIPHLGFYITGLSKSISPGLRCAYIKAPQAQVRHLAHFIRATVWLSPPLVFSAATSLINSADAFQLAARQRNIAHKRQAIAQELLPHSDRFDNTGSYHIWLPLPGDWHSEEFELAAKEQQLLVSSARYFNTAPTPLNAIRLSLMSEVSEDRYRSGLSALSLLLQQKPYKHVHF